MEGLNKHVPTDTKQADGSSEETEESRHFHEVCVAMRSYEYYAKFEIDRIERNLRRLGEDDQRLLMESVDKRISDMRAAVELNQSFLNILLTQAEDMKGNDSYVCPNRAGDSCTCVTSPVNISKVRSTLKQFAREWSDFRAEERERAYVPLLEGLKRWLPDAAGKWVLCPGSGLGRLPYEVRKLGYNSQGNEFSYFMLIGSYFILNYALEKNSMAIQPYVLNTMNRMSHKDYLTYVMLPAAAPVEELAANTENNPAGPDFSMCAGEFCTIYGGADQEAIWDSVVTCFFMDTARNVIQYVRVIAHLLKAGGVWLNLGPLLYHYAGEDSEMSIELSFEELKGIIENWFDVKEVKNYDCLYTSHPQSLMQVVYHGVYFAAIRKPTTMPALSAQSTSGAASKFDMAAAGGPSED